LSGEGVTRTGRGGGSRRRLLVSGGAGPRPWRRVEHLEPNGAQSGGRAIDTYHQFHRANAPLGDRQILHRWVRIILQPVRAEARRREGRRYSVYTVRGANGYLDIIRHWTPDSSVARDNFFVVRSLTARGPQYILDLVSEGLGCDLRDY